MAASHRKGVLEQLRRVVLVGEGARLTDGQLLTCFVEHRDEAAFEALVRRHGPMVLGVCRRVLGRHHDAEDAFQATFLVLVRKAASIRSRDTLGNWLYGVAANVALKARALAAKRGTREQQVTALPEPEVVPQGDFRADLQPLLDHELRRLPDKYRVAVVLCDLEGKTRKEVAEQLGIPEGTVSSRLARARRTLARRLARRGVELAGVSLAALFPETVSGGFPATLVSSTVLVARLYAAGRVAAAGVIPAPVAALTEGVLQAMLLHQLKKVTTVLLVLGMAALGGRLLTRSLAVGEPARDETLPALAADQPKKADDKPEREAPANDAVRSLLKERLLALKEIVAETEKAFAQRGTVSPEDVLQAKRHALLGELDLCGSEKERIGIHEKIVALAKELEQVVDARFKAGRAPHVDLLKAQVDRLNAAIALERARARAATEAK